MSPTRATASTASSSEFTTKPVTPSSTISGTEPSFHAITGVPHAMASIITSPNGSAQSMGNSRARAPRRKRSFSSPPTSPMNSTKEPCCCSKRLDLFVKVGPILLVDLRGNLQPPSRCRERWQLPGRAAFRARCAREMPGIPQPAVQRCEECAADRGTPFPASLRRETARRCELEMETSGMSRYSSSSGPKS